MRDENRLCLQCCVWVGRKKNAPLPNFQACLKSYVLPRIEWWWLFQFFLALIRAHFLVSEWVREREKKKRSSESRNYKFFRVYFAIQSRFNHRHQLFIHGTKETEKEENFHIVAKKSNKKNLYCCQLELFWGILHQQASFQFFFRI